MYMHTYIHVHTYIHTYIHILYVTYTASLNLNFRVIAFGKHFSPVQTELCKSNSIEYVTMVTILKTSFSLVPEEVGGVIYSKQVRALWVGTVTYNSLVYGLGNYSFTVPYP